MRQVSYAYIDINFIVFFQQNPLVNYFMEPMQKLVPVRRGCVLVILAVDVLVRLNAENIYVYVARYPYITYNFMYCKCDILPATLNTVCSVPKRT